MKKLIRKWLGIDDIPKIINSKFEELRLKEFYKIPPSFGKDSAILKRMDKLEAILSVGQIRYYDCLEKIAVLQFKNSYMESQINNLIRKQDDQETSENGSK